MANDKLVSASFVISERYVVAILTAQNYLQD